MSFLTSSTVKSVSAPRNQTTKAKSRAPIPTQQRKEKTTQRKHTQEEMDVAVQEWFDNTFQRAEELAVRFNKKPRYFLDKFFFGGASMVTHHEKVNPHNAFVSLKSQELRDEGRQFTMVKIQEQFKDEYNGLSDKEREKLVQEHKENIDSSKNTRRPAARGRIQDFMNTSRNIVQLINGLKARIGVKGFFCIVRNTSDYYVRPYWYYTLPRLSDYMKIAAGKNCQWDNHKIGMKAEAFSIAGCDVVNMLDTSKKKVGFLKSEIRDLITTKLVEITGNPKALMQYVRYEEDIVQRYGVVLEGWTYGTFINPSELGSSLQPLTALRDALKSDACKFVKLSPAEREKRQVAYRAAIMSNEVQPLKRKSRSDKGISRKKAKTTSTQSVNNTDGNADQQPGRSASVVQDDSD